MTFRNVIVNLNQFFFSSFVVFSSPGWSAGKVRKRTLKTLEMCLNFTVWKSVWTLLNDALLVVSLQSRFLSAADVVPFRVGSGWPLLFCVSRPVRTWWAAGRGAARGTAAWPKRASATASLRWRFHAAAWAWRGGAWDEAAGRFCFTPTFFLKHNHVRVEIQKKKCHGNLM